LPRPFPAGLVLGAGEPECNKNIWAERCTWAGGQRLGLFHLSGVDAKLDGWLDCIHA